MQFPHTFTYTIMQQINWNDFQNIELRTGTIIDVQDFPEAKNPAYKIWVDFGKEIGIKKSSAQGQSLVSACQSSHTS